MSLIDPSTRWWNRNGTRRAAAAVCWVVAIGGTLIGTWAVWIGETAPVPQPVALAVLIAAIPLLVAGSFLYKFGSVASDQDARFVLLPLALYFVALGIGGGIGQWQATDETPWMSIVFVIGGVGLIVGSMVAGPILRRNAELRARVERQGIKAQGVVTRATEYSRDHHPVTRVTVTFTDRDGAARWASDTLAGSVPLGARVSVRYSPSDLHRKAGVLITR